MLLAAAASARADAPLSVAAAASDRTLPAEPPSARHRGEFDLDTLPGAGDAAIRDLWARAIALEQSAHVLESAALYEKIAARIPPDAQVCWRISRDYWRAGDALPAEAQDRRVRYFQAADDWAKRGIEIDPDCAECMLWRFSALGNLATTRGLLTGARDAVTMARLLDRAIALRPDHWDGPHNSTLANLYYASANFYRMVPDWWWLKWVVGVRGDKERAERDIRRAVAITGERVDYQVEMGAVLLCLGEAKSRPEKREEGFAVLRRALDLPSLMPSDAKDLASARILLSEPEKACGFSGDGFLDVEAAGAGL